jgi:signal transduction histidine kinase/CheY-like chemotaxis protein
MNELCVLPQLRFEGGVRDVELSTLSLVAASTRNTVIIKDAEHRIKWVNESFKRNYGYGLEACLGQYENTQSSVPDEALVVLRYGKDGRKRWLRLENRPIVNENGELTGFIEIENDITDYKLAEEKLQEEKLAAEAEIIAKSEFLATMCHELRNPVSVMIGIMDLALQTTLTAEQREYLSLMKTSGCSLLSIVNSTLDLARVEVGCLEAEHIPFSLRENLDDTLQFLALEARKKGLKLRYEIASEVPDALLGDPLRLRQIVSNLLGNAIKFSENGDVVLRVACEGIEGVEIVYRFSVVDCGIGIAKDKQASIFEPFQQADNSTCRKYGGTGLGLAISKRLVQLMNGRIWLESELGKGSTFFFTAHFLPQERMAKLPKLAESANAKHEEGESLASGARVPDPCMPELILVVDDNPLSLRLTQMVLEKEGYRVLLADGGAAALALLEDERPDLVLMDLQMPEMDGAETARAIRLGEQASGLYLPIVALTADSLPVAYPLSLQAGMDGCLIKPIQPVLLREFIDRLPVLAAGKTPIEGGNGVVLDRGALLAQVHGDPQLLAEVSALFFDHCDKLMADAHDKLCCGDKDGFAHALHTLLGMFRSLYAIAAQHITEKLQARSIDTDADQVAALFLQLEEEVKSVKTVLIDLRNEQSWRCAA